MVLQNASKFDADQSCNADQTKIASGRTVAEKLAVFAGSGAVAAAMAASPSAADAAIVPALNTPIFPPTSDGVNNWDVDGDGTFDFDLQNSLSSSDFSFRAFFDDLNGGRLVVSATAGSDGISKLPLGVTIGTGLASAYKFHSTAQASNTITNSGEIGFDAANHGGWAFGDTGFFGFKFTIGSDTHSGWGEMTIVARGNAGGGDNFVINWAYYNDTADAPVQTGQVPEPSAVALLAMGAAGLAAWRRRREGAGVA